MKKGGRHSRNWSVLARVLPGRGDDWPLAPFARKYLRLLPFVALLGLLASLLEGVGIGLLIPLLALLLADAIPQGIPGPIRTIAEQTGALDPQIRVLALGSAVLVLIAFKALVQAGNSAFIAAIEGRIGRDLRNAMGARVLSLGFDFFIRNDSKRLAHILSTDSWFTTEAARWMFSIVPATIGLTVFSGLLVWLDWRLFLIAAAGAVAVQGMLFLFERRQRKLSSEVTASSIMMWNRMLRVVQGWRAIQIFGQAERELGAFAMTTERMRAAAFASRRLSAFVTPALDMVLAALFVLILLSAYRFNIAIPTVTAFLVLLARAQPHAHAISAARIGIASVRGSIREVEWLLSQQAEPARPAGTAAPVPAQSIRFDSVSYAYPDGSPALSNVSFELRPGTATALIGRSGAGKTTLVNLLCRLVEPSSGAIFAGERPLADIDPAAWRGTIGIAGQDIDLLDGTVAENIAYGRPDATRAEIEEAATIAGANVFIALLPEGYDSPVGEGGQNLSGGQRQRIGLARALLRRPDLLILDEATSAVDALSEREIIGLLAEHRLFNTALVISHRKSTLVACQQGIVLDHGRLLETGPLDELVYFDTMTGDEG